MTVCLRKPRTCIPKLGKAAQSENACAGDPDEGSLTWFKIFLVHSWQF